jgi:hypothetical protein
VADELVVLWRLSVPWWRSFCVVLYVLTMLAFAKDASASSGVGPKTALRDFCSSPPPPSGGTLAASLDKHLEKSDAYDENESGSCLAAVAVNTIPTQMARVVPAEFADTATLGAPGASEAWVTAAETSRG